MSLSTLLKGYFGSGVNESDYVRIDGSTNSLQVIDYAHHEIHEGSSFVASKVFTAPVGGKVNIGMITPAGTTNLIHLTFSVICDAAYTVSFYEADDYEGGTLVTGYNRNREVGTPPADLDITHTDTDQGSGTGTELWTFAGGANKTVTTSGSDRHEFVLENEQSYLLEVTASQNDIVTIELNWYEHTDKH